MLPKTSFINGTTVEPAWLNSIPLRNCEQVPDYISGLGMFHPSNGDSVKIMPGIAVCWGGAGEYIALDNSCDKSIEGTWVAGQMGGRPPAVPLTDKTWYHVFVIRNTNTGANDCGFDTNIGASNLRQYSGYNLHRRIGSIYYSTSAKIPGFHQYGDMVYWEYNTKTLIVIAPSSQNNLVKVNPFSPPCQTTVAAKIVGSNCQAYVLPGHHNFSPVFTIDQSKELAIPTPITYASIPTDSDGKITIIADEGITGGNSVVEITCLGYCDRRYLP